MFFSAKRFAEPKPKEALLPATCFVLFGLLPAVFGFISMGIVRCPRFRGPCSLCLVSLMLMFDSNVEIQKDVDIRNIGVFHR